MTRRKRELAPEERRLWSYVLRETTPLPGRELPAPNAAADPEAVKGDAAPAPSSGSVRGFNPGRTDPPRTEAARWSLDSATQRRIRRGRIVPEGTLDLHGMRQEEARQALIRFVAASRRRGRRCVLIITGKGLTPARPDPDLAPFMQPAPARGVIRARFMDWIREEPLRDQVFWAEPAHPSHGGAGAQYLFLKRRPGH